MVKASVRKARERMRLGRAAVIAAGLALAIALPATTMAGKGGGGRSTTSWIVLAAASGSGFAAAEPRLGDSVRFDTGYPTATKNPWISLTCYQEGALVYGEGGKPDNDFVLGGASSRWVEAGGAASCRAELGDLFWRGGKQYYTYLAHTTFEAGG